MSSVNVVFHLKRPNSSGRQAVYALYCFGPNRVKIYTGISVDPKNWNKTRQRITRSSNNSVQLNDLLDQVEADIIRVVRQLRINHQRVTVKRIREEYNRLTKSKSSRPKDTFVDEWLRWVEKCEATKRRATVSRYITVLKHLQSFSEAKRIPLTFEYMDANFVDGLYSYLINDIKLTNPSAWNVFKIWKTFMKWAVENDLTNNRYFERVKAKDYNIQAIPIVRLTETELNTIKNLNLEGDKRLENVRDTFLLACCIGVRYGDLQQIIAHPGDYVIGEAIQLTTQKNRKAVTIPIIPIAREILNRAPNLRSISNQKFNKFIKEIAEMAGLTKAVVLPEYRGSIRIDRKFRICDLVSAHTAKRTFVSLMIARNVSVDVLMRITGNSRRTIDRYVQLSNEEVINEMQKAVDLLQ